MKVVYCFCDLKTRLSFMLKWMESEMEMAHRTKGQQMVLSSASHTLHKVSSAKQRLKKRLTRGTDKVNTQMIEAMKELTELN